MPHIRPPLQSFLSSKHTYGFTYLSVLILLTIIAIASTATLEVASLHQRRAAEEELLEIGLEFRNALLSYADATPAGQAQRAPKILTDLIKDPRYPTTRRYLRKLYADPITGKEEWGTVLSPDGKGIIGMYSLSTQKPIKIANFEPALQDFAGKAAYHDWKFMIAPQQLTLPLPNSTK